MRRRLTPDELATILRWAAGINGDGPRPDALFEITWQELDQCVDRAYERVITGTVKPPPAAPVPSEDPGYRPPAWLADIMDPGLPRQSRMEG